MVMTSSERPSAAARTRLVLRVVGAGLLIATAAIHLDLYVTGYRTIPTIGWLFLGQVIAGFVLGAAVLVTGSRLAAAAGAGFALSTLGGYALSVFAGLFGFTEVRTTAGIVAGIIEIAAFAALAVFAALPSARDLAGQPTGLPGWMARLRAGQPGATGAVAGVAVVALIVLGVTYAHASGGGSAPAAGGRAVLKVTRIGGKRVLTNARGFTVYLFGPDTSTTSACKGSCTQYWPPVIGKPVLPAGTPGAVGAIRRSDGKLQATYNGHPLYTYISDQAPGQAKGNGVTLNGGIWREIVVSG
jgi:predicted lipoprotein with Yx(FWY)xxD motif